MLPHALKEVSSVCFPVCALAPSFFFPSQPPRSPIQMLPSWSKRWTTASCIRSPREDTHSSKDREERCKDKTAQRQVGEKLQHCRSRCLHSEDLRTGGGRSPVFLIDLACWRSFVCCCDSEHSSCSKVKGDIAICGGRRAGVLCAGPPLDSQRHSRAFLDPPNLLSCGLSPYRPPSLDALQFQAHHHPWFSARPLKHILLCNT